jgi:hypothetical protein
LTQTVRFWTDDSNVFNHITSHIAFSHGSSPHTTVNHMWYNDSEAPNLEGDANRDVRDASGKCVNVTIEKLAPQAGWPSQAQAVIDNAGRRTGSAVPVDPVAPVLTPPSPAWPPPGYKECCATGNYTQCKAHPPG